MWWLWQWGDRDLAWSGLQQARLCAVAGLVVEEMRVLLDMGWLWNQWLGVRLSHSRCGDGEAAAPQLRPRCPGCVCVTAAG
ncbi:hypothetical protein SSCG_06051 [Streptomyces clavuligerus]|nr:hypothetical protein SSCG_06051 [Streptomyces clavuligerus]